MLLCNVLADNSLIQLVYYCTALAVFPLSVWQVGSAYTVEPTFSLEQAVLVFGESDLYI